MNKKGKLPKIGNLVLSIFVIFINSSIGFSQVSSCNDFHTGKFYYPYVESEANVIVIRKKKRQIEKSRLKDGRKNKIVCKLDWVDDCTYRLILSKVSLKKDISKIGQVIIVTITELKENEFYFSAKSESGLEIRSHWLRFRKNKIDTK